MRGAHPGFDAKIPTPFALIGVRTEGGKVAEIVYLPRSSGAQVPANALAEKVCRQVIPRSVRLSEAPSFGQPIITFDPASRGSLAYRILAKEVAGDAKA